MDLLATLAIPYKDQDPENPPLVITISCTEAYIAVSLNDTSVHVFSSVDYSHISSFQDPCGENVWALAILGENVAVGSADGVLRIWGVGEGTFLHSIPPPTSTSTSTSEPPYITHLHVLLTAPPSILAATSSGTIHHWIPGSKTYTRSFLNGHKATIPKIQTYDNGNKFVSAAYEGTVCAWDVNSCSLIWKFEMDVLVFGLGVGEGKVAVGRRDGEVRILKLEDGTEISSFKAHKQLVNGLIFHRNNLISTGTDGFAKFWSPSTNTNTNTYTLKLSTQLHDHAIMTRCILGPWLITGGKNGGGEENVCGLDCSVKVLRIDGADEGDVVELGFPVVMVWEVVKLGEGRVVVALMKRGRPTLEVWGLSS